MEGKFNFVDGMKSIREEEEKAELFEEILNKNAQRGTKHAKRHA